MADPTGLARGLTQYGGRDYALYLRRSHARSMGYSQADQGRDFDFLRGTRA
ncbi:MAG TPA: hypothetical protein VGR79_08580 [Stellaceae bacterium]|nr:hypothetical protein [Stellaceae bacterium]